MTSEISRDCASGPRTRSTPFAGLQGIEARDGLPAAIVCAPRGKSVMAGAKPRAQRSSTSRHIAIPHRFPLPVHPGARFPYRRRIPVCLSHPRKRRGTAVIHPTSAHVNERNTRKACANPHLALRREVRGRDAGPVSFRVGRRAWLDPGATMLVALCRGLLCVGPGVLAWRPDRGPRAARHLARRRPGSALEKE